MEQHTESTANTVPDSIPHTSKEGEAAGLSAKDVSSKLYRDSASSNNIVTSHPLPIPPASEPMQYRAIGLIKGTYVPSEEQFTRGTLMTDDDQPVDAVLLGRVMSLVKKHVDLTVPHLWVVYPRTRPKSEHLHAQIVGIWEPDKLNRDLLANEVEDEAHSGVDATSEDTDVLTTDLKDSEGKTELAATESLESQDSAVESVDAPETKQSEDQETPSTQVDIAEEAESEPAEGEASTDADLEKKESDEIDTPEETADSSEVEALDAPSDESKPPQLVKPARPKFSAQAAQAANTTEVANPASGLNVSQIKDKGEAGSTQSTSSASSGDAQPILEDGYFSIRGEVLQFAPENDEITVRIRQASRKGGGSSGSNGKPKDDSKEFKLQLYGRLEGRIVGYFWDFQVQRQGNNLVVFDSTMIGVVPPRKGKRKKMGGPSRGGRGGIKRRYDDNRKEGRPGWSGDRPAAAPSRRVPGSKPVLKKNSTSNSGRQTNAEN